MTILLYFYTQAVKEVSVICNRDTERPENKLLYIAIIT